MMPLLLSGRHLRHRKVSLSGFQVLRLTSSTAVPLAVDGEPLPAASEIEVRVRAGALAVVRAR
jgi:diacylglycerol kinase family enzyme